MSIGSTRSEFAYDLAPHQLSNSLYSAQGSCSSRVVPSNSTPVIFDSAVYPTVDCQARAFYDTPRQVTGLSGSMGIFGGYRQTQSLEPQSPIGLPSPGPVFGPAPVYNFYGCPQ